MLADSLRTSYYCEQDQELKTWQIKVTQSFLKLYDQYYFGQSLALAILKGKEMILIIQDNIIEAIENSLIRLNQDTNIEFDLAFQVACLLITIAANEDDLVAYYANKLLSLTNPTMMKIAALSLLASSAVAFAPSNNVVRSTTSLNAEKSTSLPFINRPPLVSF